LNIIAKGFSRSACLAGISALTLFTFISITQVVHAQDARQRRTTEPGGMNLQTSPTSEPEQNNQDKNQDKKETTLPIPAETKVETKHDWTAGARPVHYTATAGTLLIRDTDNKPYGSMFYVAYTEDGAAAKSRPVTFLYNGGPGSATIWLHMGSVGPVRVVTDSPNATGPAPYQLVPNQYSLLDKTDLVFIDAPLTGFSRAVGKGTVKDLTGVDPDIKAFEKFIVRYITINQRWNSPKFLFGESYGTTRSAGLVAALNNDGVEFNGVTILSSILNYGVRIPGYDTEDWGYLPSYAAIAWYHKKVPQTVPLAQWVEQARQFAGGPYADALLQGDRLSKADFDATAQKVAYFTGLPVDYVKDANLRINGSRFRKELLRGDDEIVGRYDARFEGYDVDAAGENAGYDPSDTGISGAFVGAFHDYLTSELKYTTNENYDLQAPRTPGAAGGGWDEHHQASGAGFGGGGRGGQTMPDVAVDLADAIRKNPHLHVFSANGYFDLATPFFITEFDIAHMGLPPSLRGNVQFGYYPAGHMVYLNVAALKMLHDDMERFYPEAAGQ
jgi:carboxypeptidase C (cathepsin A)